ncbi:DUF4232 domain-containing protein [Streptomyces sp. NPDC056222]|uniref:DUF4232 domain-containing protein n=1 Tax=Streptomyces sp. NPDC056222 TaxID=3345749 RepID=UPI0035D7D3DB
MRTFRTRTTVLAATTAALALALTACGGADDAGTKDKKAAASVSQVTPSTGATESGTGTTGGTGATETGTGTGTTGGNGTSGGDTSGAATSAAQTGAKKKNDGSTPACTANDVKISAVKQDGVPTTHITLTATNVSGRSCTLLQYPLIAFGDIQTAKDVPSVAKSKPGTPVVLSAGAPAYAAVRINNGGVDEENRAVTSFNVNLFAKDGPAEGSKVVKAPAGGIAVDDAAARTGYWTHELRNGADEF